MPINEFDQTLQDLAPATPPASPSVNAYEQTIAEEDAGRAQTFKRALVQAEPTPPDRAAQIQKLATRTGLPADIIDRNFEDVQKRARIADTPYSEMLRDSPVLTNWITEQPPVQAAVAKDDLENLGFLEWLMTAPKRAWDQGTAQVEYGFLRHQELYRDLTTDERAQLDNARTRMNAGGQLGAGSSWFRGAITGGAQNLPNMIGAWIYGAKRGIPAAITAGGAAALYGAAAGPAAPIVEGIGVPAAFAGGMSAGMFVGAGEFTKAMESGLAYDEYLNFRDELGRPIDRNVAKAAALATGYANATLEAAGLEFLFKSIPGIDHLTGAASRNLVKKALRVPTVRAALFEAIKSYGETLTAESSVEVAQRAATILAGELAKATGKVDTPKGQLAPGNVNLYQQPAVQNQDGSVSTVDSVSINIDGKEVLIPRVTPDGRHLSTEEATAEYRKTGKNLGTFDSPEAADAFAEQLHTDYANGVYNKPGEMRTPSDVGADLLQEGLGAVQAFALTIAPGPVGRFVQGLQHARTAQANVAFFQALGEGVAQSKTGQRSPEALHSFLDAATKDGPVSHVYADVNTWTNYWQEKGLDPAAVATEVTGSRDAYDQAVNTGEPLEIPTSRYAVKLAATEHNGFWANELRLAPDQMNGREAVEFQSTVQQLVEAEQPAEPTATEQIHARVVDQLVKAGIEPQTAESYATLYGNAFGSLAERAGVNPEALYSHYGLTVQRGEETAPTRQAPPTTQALPLPAPTTSETGQIEAPASAANQQGETANPQGQTAAPAAGQGESGGEAPVAARPGAESGQSAAAASAPPPSRALPSTPADVAKAVAASLGALHEAPEASTLAASGAQVESTQAGPGSLDSTGEQPGPINPAAAGRGAELPGGAAQPGAAVAGRGGAEGSRTAGARQGRPVRLPEGYAPRFSVLADGARRLGFTGSDRQLSTLFRDRLDQARQIARDLASVDDDQQHSSGDLLKAIARAGGLGIEAESKSGARGELENMLESLNRLSGKQRGRNAGTSLPKEFRRSGGLPGAAGIIVRKGGLAVDSVRESINEDPRWRGQFENLSDFLAAVDNAIRIETGTSEAPGAATFDVDGILQNLLGVRPESAWWAPLGQHEVAPGAGENNASGESAASVEAINRDAAMKARDERFVVYDRTGARRALIGVDAVDYVAQPGETYGVEGPQGFRVLDDRGGKAPAANVANLLHEDAILNGDLQGPDAGDTTFDISEFDQGLFDELQDDPASKVDVLTTGELQPRLPGAENVRDQEVAQPQLGQVQDEFKLTPPEETAHTQTTLFQGAAREPLTPESLHAFVADLRRRTGPDLAAFDVSLQPDGRTLKLEMIAIVRGAQRAGLGTAVMQELTQFADAHDSRLTLTTVQGHGQRAHAELVKFYKRFGFVENKGRNLDPALGEEMYRDPGVKAGKTGLRGRTPLIVQHNLTAEKLQHALKMGGLPVPSLAIAKADNPITGFGDITLIGPKELADPKGYAKPRVFGADVYAPRYPTIHFGIPRASEKIIEQVWRAEKDVTGQTYFDLDELQKQGAKYLRDSAAVRAAFLRSQGIDPSKFSEPDTGKYARPGQVDTFRTGSNLRDAIDDQKLGAAYDRYVTDLWHQVDASERIFRGFTNAGNRSYQPHTLENVVRILKKELRGGETESNIYGVGQLRSKFTPQFRSLAAIQKESGRIVTDAEFEAVKQEVETDLFTIVDALKGNFPSRQNEFGFVDTVMAIIADTPKLGLDRTMREFSAEGEASDAARKQIYEFIAKLRTLPTEYFEAKVTRAVDVSEFAGAAVPEGTPADVIDALKSRGLHVETYAKTDDKEQSGRRQAIARLTQQLGGKVLFQEGDRRGFLRFGPDRQMNIGLLERADLSTFLHETGHFYLEVFGDLADQVKALPAQTATQQQLLTDYQTLLGWLGVESRSAVAEAQHEQFARGFEAYLMDGKAPSIELRSAFARFRSWLVAIYTSVKALRVNLTDDVRRVMDRMVATDKAIFGAEQEGRVEPMFTTPESAGMTETGFGLYRAAVAEAARATREKLERRVLGELQREQTAEWKRRRDVIRANVEQDVNQRPVYQAIAAITKGTRPDGTSLVESEPGLLGEPEPLKLDRAAIVDEFGPDRLKRLPRGLVATDGHDPAMVARMFGYSSPDEMLYAIENAAPAKAVIEHETTARMFAEHGSVLLDGTMHERAREAVATEERESLIRAELRALGQLRLIAAPFVKQGEERLAAEKQERAYERRWMEAEAKLRVELEKGKNQALIADLKTQVRELRSQARGGAATIRAAIPPANVLESAARDRLAQMRVRDLNPAKFWSASRQAAQRALDLAARQDFAGAIVAKQQELINTHLYRQASTLRDDIDGRVKKIREQLTKAGQARLGLAGGSYLEQYRALAERYSFAPVSGPQLDRLATLRRWMEDREADGLPIDLPEDVLDDARRVPYQQLTTEEFSGIADALDNIAHVAQLERRRLKAADDRSFFDARDQLVTSIQTNNTRRDPKLEYTAKDERSRRVSDWFASHSKLSFLARALDGYQDGGALWDAIVRPLNRAADDEFERKGTASQAFAKIVRKAYGRESLSQKLYIAAIGDSLSHEARVAVALQWGNADGQERLLNDPVRKWTRDQVLAVLDTLDRRDWDFVQATWDFLDGFWPEIAAKQQRVTGLEPEKVLATPVETKFGEYRGGYYPLAYDGRMVPRADQVKAASEAKLAATAAYVRTTTRRGHTEARKRSVRLPVRLDLSVAFEHVDQVIHDLTHHEALIDVTRTLRDGQVSKAIVEHAGDVVYQQFTRAVQDIALGYVPGRGILDTASTWLRTRTQLALLGWNLWTAVQQPLGVFNGAAEVGAKYVARGMRRWLRDAASMENTARWINEVSPFMRERGGNLSQDLNDLRTQLRKGGWFDKMLRTVTNDVVGKEDLYNSFLWHIGMAQRVADIPTWLGAYEKFMETNAGDEQRAIALADQAVRNAQGGGSMVDLANVQRGSPIARLWLVFYSYGNVVFNQSKDAIGRTSFRSPRSTAALLGNLSLIYAMPALGTVLMGHAFGKLPSGDDVPDWLKEWAQEDFRTAMNTMVGVRELAGLADTRGYAGPAGARTFELITNFTQQAEQGHVDEAFLRALNTLGGSLFGYPAAQIQRTADGFAALEDGRTYNPLALLFGAPPKHVKH